MVERSATRLGGRDPLPAEQDGGAFGGRLAGALGERLGRGAADRVVDDDVAVAWRPQRARHYVGGADEHRGHDAGRGKAEPLPDDGVVQTARRAAASIADAGDRSEERRVAKGYSA